MGNNKRFAARPRGFGMPPVRATCHSGWRPGIHMLIHITNAPNPGAFFIRPNSISGHPLTTAPSLGLSSSLGKSLELHRPTIDDEAAPRLWPLLRMAPNLDRSFRIEEHANAYDLNARTSNGLLQDMPEREDPHLVGRLNRTFHMNPLYSPAVMDGGSSHDGNQLAIPRGPNKSAGGGGTSWDVSEEAVPPSGEGPTAEHAANGKIDQGKECEEIRGLMPEHLLYTPNANVTNHIRICDECHSILMTLRIEIQAAAEEAEERKNRK
jgi:hypothetical protein